jgi:hypothetical protein
VLRSRFLASWAGSVLRRIPAVLLERLERSAHVAAGNAPPPAADPAFFAILGAPRFAGRVDPAWRAPLDAEGSWTKVHAWMRHAGY